MQVSHPITPHTPISLHSTTTHFLTPLTSRPQHTSLSPHHPHHLMPTISLSPFASSPHQQAHDSPSSQHVLTPTCHVMSLTSSKVRNPSRHPYRQPSTCHLRSKHRTLQRSVVYTFNRLWWKLLCFPVLSCF
ncbi:hypothetical protein E2C01_043149 [Portunus trituberculatus]|uniref:Uncharacterized protein n=1 Tax=Portunus trituberculatus TaxID=210409 RepID=A0A5B7FNP3_PORTR|nr:hypothetical protein [Portunus trituberculatus]